MEYLQYKSLAIIIWFILIFLLEHLKPSDDFPKTQKQRLFRNVCILILSVGASTLVIVPMTEWGVMHNIENISFRPEWAMGGWGLIFDILLLDFLIYWWHRFNHEISFLWRFHQVHHLDQFLDSTSAFRFHFGETILSAFFRIFIIFVFDFSIGAIILFETLVLFSAIFHHSNMKLPLSVEKALSHIIITPSIHWVHHHAVHKDTNSNYGTIFSFWDRIFRTSNKTYSRVPGMIIGVAGKQDKPVLNLLTLPFKKQSD